MKTSHFFAACGLFLLIAGPAQAQALSVTPGLWEFKSESGADFVRGDQTMSTPTRRETTTMCLAKEDAALSPAKLATAGCATSEPTLGQRRLSFLMTCSQGGVELSGVLVFNLSEDKNSGDSFVSMSGEAGGGAFLATTKSQARRIGDC